MNYKCSELHRCTLSSTECLCTAVIIICSISTAKSTPQGEKLWVWPKKLNWSWSQRFDSFSRFYIQISYFTRAMLITAAHYRDLSQSFQLNVVRGTEADCCWVFEKPLIRTTKDTCFSPACVSLVFQDVDVRQQAVEEMMHRIKRGVQLRPVSQSPNRSRKQVLSIIHLNGVLANTACRLLCVWH